MGNAFGNRRPKDCPCRPLTFGLPTSDFHDNLYYTNNVFDKQCFRSAIWVKPNRQQTESDIILWSSESIIQTCLDYADSWQSKAVAKLAWAMPSRDKGRRSQGGRRSQLVWTLPWRELTNEAWAEMSLLNLCHARRKKAKPNQGEARVFYIFIEICVPKYGFIRPLGYVF